MAEEDDTGGYSQSQPNSNTILLRTDEDVAKELKRWISTGSDVGSKNFYRKAIEDIESKLNRPLSCLELTWFQRQYVITLLQLWLKKSLGKAFEYLNDEENDVSQLSTILTQLNSINSFEDIRSIKLNDVESPLFNLCDGDCRYLKLILEQEDLFKNTPRFTAFVKCYLKQFKTSCIEKVFSRCLNDIVTDKTNGEIHGKFMVALNQFLSNVNEEKNFKDIVDKEEFLSHYLKGENKTGRDIIKQLVEMFGSSSETEQEGTVARLEWLQTFLSNANSISEEEWTPKLQLLTKEICKKFLLPETDIKFKEEDGKQIISIRGVVIFVSQMMTKMIDLKVQHSGVEEIQIIGLQSVHIDCHLDNGTWHGINIGITTDKLIVDDPVNDGSFCWNVSGEKADDQLKGKRVEPGESGGNVRVVCNQIINGQKWTIISDGGDGSDCYKWTEEEFEKSFPSMSTGDKKENMKTVLKTLQEILPNKNRTEGQDISPEHTGNFVVRGSLEDDSEITVIFYKEKKIFPAKQQEQTLISIRGGRVGQGGYGGDIAMECFGNNEMNPTPGGVPFTGLKNQTPLTAVRCGVYEALGSNGNVSKRTGDVAFIQKNADAESGQFYGFETDEVIRIELRKTKVEQDDIYVEYEDAENKKRYAVFKKNSESYTGTIKTSAIKKKSVIRQSLVRHLDQIDERNQLTDTLHKMLSSNPTGHHSSNIVEIINEMDNKVHQFHQLTTQRQQNQLEQIQKVQFVKPAIDSSSLFPKPKIIGRRPVWNDNKGDDGQLKDNSQKNVSVYCLDELFTEDGSDSVLHCLFGQINSEGKYVCNEQRDVDWIIKKMTEDPFNMNVNVKERVVKVLGLPAIEEIDIPKAFKAIETWINHGLDLIDAPSLKKFLDVFDYAVKQKMGFKLRDTQKVTLIILLFNKLISPRQLTQVSTGEGKSIIVAGVAIGFALSKPITKTKKDNNKKTDKRKNNKVDVITSNDVLALRDSSLPVAEGGLKELYEFFNVTVSNNCSQSVDERTSAYNMDVVYGQLANFQRDYLLDTFYNRHIRGDRQMEISIIDEADCMLLDRGNNVLYLSHDIPGMETLESLYVFIWAKIQTVKTDEELELIKSTVLFDLYGQITEKHLNSIHALLGEIELESERSEMWEHLIEKKVIDQQGRLLINDVNEITEEIINYMPTNETLKRQQLNSKIVFYLRTIIKRERRIRMPDQLLAFVDRHLDTWLDNARRALELKQDEDYVIDCDRSDTNPDLNPQVIIIDPETGTDQFNSQWDGALHQFLQLKEGCKMTLQSLKAVFISNANYLNKYENLVGVSGTLGSKPEQDFLKVKYECDLFTIPTAEPKRFSLKSPKLLKTKECWRKAIIEETRRTIMDEKRSIVIFCRSIKEVNKVHQYLKTEIPVLKDNKNKRIHRYTRDYEKFEFESKNLDEGHVIVATNLAGRGTDIKLSETLKANGGLHICLTYFPENERVEEQAMGRAARKGEPGSGILILCEEPRSGEEWDEEKIFVMKEERAWKEWQRITQLEKDFNYIGMLENLSEESTDLISKNKIKEEISKEENNEIVKLVQQLNDNELLTVIHDNLLDNWAMWLDETDFNFKCYNIKQRELLIDLKKIIIDIPNCMTPARKVTFAKHLAMEKSNKTGKKIDPKDTAIDILKSVISSPDNFFYPSAFYYHAFVLLTKSDLGKDEFKKEKEKFIRMLRNAETILNGHIDMQIFFIQIHQSERKLESSFYTVDGYKEQKENNIKILEYFLRSIQWMLGSHCSISDLQKTGSEPPNVPGKIAKKVKAFQNYVENKKKKTSEELKNFKIRSEKVDEYFSQLLKSKCIGCEFNESDTIPNVTSPIDKSKIVIKETRSKIILQIAKDYGVSASLEKKLKFIFDRVVGEPLNEEEIERKLKKEIEILCTRKVFWKKLIVNEVLHPLTHWKEMECFIMSEKILEELNLDKGKAIKSEFGSKSFDETTNRLYVLYNPTYDSQQHLAASKKIMFSKEYVKDKLVSTEKYREKKKYFESNKIARLDLDKLSKVDLKSFGRFCTVDLDRIHIANESDQAEIWRHLIDQGIIDEDGNFVLDYDLTKDFLYPDCPEYAKAVAQLIRKKFVVELVRQQWLNFKKNSYCLKAIHLLPRKPYRDMLADLMAAHVISGARVTEHFAIDFKGEINKITEYDQERDCLMEYLTTRQSIITAKPITPEFVLDFIERDIHFASELYISRLVGFDRVIDIKDRKWTTKSKLLAPLIVTGGLVSIGLGVFLTLQSNSSPGLSKNLFFMGGFSDILYAVETILSRKDFTWADYGRQRIRSAMGEMKPIDAIKAISKLSGSSNQSFSDATVSNEHRWNKRTDQNQVNTQSDNRQSST